MQNNWNAAFASWMEQVDKTVFAKVGVSYLDLPDIAYRDLFDDGATPVSAANKAIKEAKSG